MNTLRNILKYYNEVEKITLIIGDHTINIDTCEKGSAFIIRAFEDKKFYILKVNGKYIKLGI